MEVEIKERLRSVEWKDKIMHKVIDDDLREAIYRQILHWWGVSHNFAKFPSPMPISMSFEELQSIGKDRQHWYVSEKTDGQHYILYFGMALGKPVQALLDRTLTLHLVSFEIDKGYHMGTVMEGEWLGDTFHVFDLIASAGRVTRYLHFSDRQALLQKIIPTIRPVEGSPFRIVQKRFFPVSVLPSYLDKWKHQELNGLTDGLIFAYDKHALITKSHVKLLKWKPPHYLTVDFYLTLSNAEEGNVQFLSVENDKPYVFVEQPQSTLSLKEDDYDSIWECQFSKEGYWKPIRHRKDKLFPNSKYVAQKTWAHILDNVSLPIVCDYLFPSG